MSGYLDIPKEVEDAFATELRHWESFITDPAQLPDALKTLLVENLPPLGNEFLTTFLAVDPVTCLDTLFNALALESKIISEPYRQLPLERGALLNLLNSVLAYGQENLNPQIIQGVIRFCYYLSLLPSHVTVFLRSLCTYGKSLETLYTDALKGDPDAVAKLVKLEPLYVTSDVARFHMYRSRVSGDISFTKSIAYALSVSPLPFEPASKEHTILAALVMNHISFPGSWDFWFDFLTHKDLMHFESPDSFTRVCRLAGIKKPYPKDRQPSD